MNSIRALRGAGLGMVVIALSACANVSGLGGTSDFGCKAPQGVPCLSVSGVDANERAGALPWQQGAPQPMSGRPAAPRPIQAGLTMPRSAIADGSESNALGALRSDPTVIRIWIAPWEDTDGDLVDQSYVYLQIDAGRWLIEHNRDLIRRAFAPRAPVVASTRTPTAVPASAGAAAVAAPGNSTPAQTAGATK